MTVLLLIKTVALSLIVGLGVAELIKLALRAVSRIPLPRGLVRT